MDSARNPWHRGELLAQALAGVDPAHALRVAPFLRDHLNEQHAAFYPRLPFLVAGAVDADGRPWATLLEGLPGFLSVPDAHHLDVRAQVADDDPARPGLVAGGAVGLLGIELPTRRRNRLNGRISAATEGRLTVEVDRAYGNCPRYIHTRELDWVVARPEAAQVLDVLDDDARSAIRGAGMFFVASYVDDAGGRQVDVSHRGGRPGFVDVDGDVLTIPDFPGNRFFNTLGNLVANPRAGLVFPGFESGDLLQVSGAAEVLFDRPSAADFEGAERFWRVRVERVVRRRGALRWRGAVQDPAAEVEPTGTWDEVRGRGPSGKAIA